MEKIILAFVSIADSLKRIADSLSEHKAKVTVGDAVEVAPEKPSKREKNKPEQEKDTPPPAPADTSDDSSLVGEDAPTVTLEDIKAIGKAVLNKNKHAEVKALVAKYKASNLSSIDPKHFPAVHAALLKLNA